MVVGALGEVGRSVSTALVNLGHEVVPVSSRVPVDRTGTLALPDALPLIKDGGIDFVIHAGGRGDKRPGQRDPSTVTASLGRLCEACGVIGVLISTVRVLEDAAGPIPGSAAAECHTDYAQMNASNETVWRDVAPNNGYVLRLANFFCEPMGSDSPQTELLPWSLLKEALERGSVDVRSSPIVSREFVSSQDVAKAALAVSSAQTSEKVTSTIPGLRLTMEQLIGCVSVTLTSLGASDPVVTFGNDEAGGPQLLPDWLASHGWSSTLTPDRIADAMGHWLSEHGLMQR